MTFVSTATPLMINSIVVSAKVFVVVVVGGNFVGPAFGTGIGTGDGAVRGPTFGTEVLGALVGALVRSLALGAGIDVLVGDALFAFSAVLGRSDGASVAMIRGEYVPILVGLVNINVLTLGELVAAAKGCESKFGGLVPKLGAGVPVGGGPAVGAKEAGVCGVPTVDAGVPGCRVPNVGGSVVAGGWVPAVCAGVPGGGMLNK